MDVMMKIISLLGVWLLLYETDVAAMPFGAPSSACADMRPGLLEVTTGMGHTAAPQSGSPPFTLTWVRQGDTSDYRITLSADDYPEFRGFFIQVRDHDSFPFGEFRDMDMEMKHVNCGNPFNAVTHLSNYNKRHVTVMWTDQEEGRSPENLVATVVESTNMYWMINGKEEQYKIISS